MPTMKLELAHTKYLILYSNREKSQANGGLTISWQNALFPMRGVYYPQNTQNNQMRSAAERGSFMSFEEN